MSSAFTRNNTLAAKAVGIIFMLSHHLFSASQLEIWKLDISDEWIQFSAAGKLCVGIFIFLSGYGLTLKYELMIANCPGGGKKKKYTNDFIKQCYFRLVSSYIFVFILCQIVGILPFLSFYKVYGQDKGSRIFYFIINAFGLSALFHMPTLNLTWWYISLAFVVIIILPIIVQLYKKVGIALVLFSALVPYIMNVESGIEFFQWFFCLMLSVMCAEENLFHHFALFFFKKSGMFWIAKLIRILLLSISISIFLYMRKFNIKVICNGMLVFSIIGLTWELLPDGSTIQRPFLFLGKHATNIFLIHTLIYQNMGMYIYSLKQPIKVLFALLILSLLISLIIESLKKILYYVSSKIRNTIKRN